MLLGCIPVFLADATALPFDGLLPWPDIALRVEEREALRLRDILAAVPAEHVARMQAGLLAHRGAYCYCCTEHVEQRPMHYVLEGLKARKRLLPAFAWSVQ